jgi:hypothetical protein
MSKEGLMDWVIETDTERALRSFLSTDRTEVPPREQKLGATTVRWWEGKPGDAVVMADGGSAEDRTVAEQYVTAQLAAIGYKRAQFTFDPLVPLKRTAGWVDIMNKAKRLIMGGAVQMLRNGVNNIIGHVIGDHGEYNTEIGRDDPNSRTITTWKCECPWDQYAWQRTRKWKKYEGRPCAHVMALYWKSLATPLDDHDPSQHGPLDPGQKGGPPAPPEGSPSPEGPPAAPGAMPEVPEAPGVPAGGASPSGPPGAPPVPGPMAPPAAPGALPPSPMEQLQQMQPPIPGATPGGMPANPSVISIPGAKLPSPFNPIQYPGGTYSKTAAQFENAQVVRLKEDGYGMAVGKSEAHGAGQYQTVPAGSVGEVLAQDPTTGWVECIFPLDDSGPMEPYHVQLFCEPSDIEATRHRNTPFIQRRS